MRRICSFIVSYDKQKIKKKIKKYIYQNKTERRNKPPETNARSHERVTKENL